MGRSFSELIHLIVDNLNMLNFSVTSHGVYFVSDKLYYNFFHMELKDIKQQLSIGQVLQHYGLKPDRNNRLLCPFHNDKTPSLQIYPSTNTYCCFSSNCNAAHGDAIQFIQLKENCTKHEAILKAGSMIPQRHGSSNLLFRTDEKLPAVTDLDQIGFWKSVRLF